MPKLAVPPKAHEIDPKLSPEETFFELTARRKAFAASDDTWIEQPHITKPNVPLQPAREDTLLQQPSPRTRLPKPSEDGDDEEF